MDRTRPLVALGLALIATTARADDPEKPGAPIPSDPVFTALLTDGSTATGRIQQLGPEGRLTLADAEERALPLERVVKLTREGASPPFPPEGQLALFPDGDRLRIIISAAGEAGLDVHSSVLDDLVIPLESLLGLVLTPPLDPEELEAVLARVRDEPRRSEVLWLTNGDRLAGGFLGLTPRAVEFQAGAGKLSVDKAQVVALGFDPALVAYARPEGLFLELTLADGSRLGARDARVEPGQLVARTRFGAEVRVPLGELARVHVRSEAIDYLSGRAADQSAYVGYVGPTRPYRRDLTVDGHPLRLSGQLYDRGLGTQSRTLLAYRLRPGDRRFQATIGLDDRAGPLGSVVFRVQVDKQERYASPPMAARDTPRAVDVDVSGGRVLILITEFGERGGVRDLADWAEARLIR